MTVHPYLNYAEAFAITACTCMDSWSDYLGWAGCPELAERARALTRAMLDLQDDMDAEIRRQKEDPDG